MFRSLRPLIESADLRAVPRRDAARARPPAGYPRFRSPPALARAIRRTGWDACSTASNHSVDAGQDGDRQHGASAEPRRASATPARSPLGPARARAAAAHRRARGARRAARLHGDRRTGCRAAPLVRQPGAAAPRDRRRAPRTARRRRRRDREHALGHGVQPAPPMPPQRRVAARVMRSRALTAIVGQHAHVVQPIRHLRGGWVVFGEGNLLSNQTGGLLPGRGAGRARRAAARRRRRAARARRARRVHRRPGCATPTTPCCRSGARSRAGRPTPARCGPRGGGPSRP